MYFTTLWSKMTAISIQKNWFTAIWSTIKTDPIYFQVEKTGSQLFRTIKTVSQRFGVRKSGSLLLGEQKM